jgi:hypothetical protein
VGTVTAPVHAAAPLSAAAPPSAGVSSTVPPDAGATSTTEAADGGLGISVDVPVEEYGRWLVFVIAAVLAVVLAVLLVRTVARRVSAARALSSPAVVRAAPPADPGRAVARSFARTSRMITTVPPAMAARLLAVTALTLREPGGDVAVASIAQRWSVRGGSKEAHALLAALGATAGGGPAQLVVTAGELSAVVGEEPVSLWLASVAEADAAVPFLDVDVAVADILDAAASVLEAAAAPPDPMVARDAAVAWDVFLRLVSPFLGPAGLARAHVASLRVGELGADLVTRLAGQFAVARDQALDTPRRVVDARDLDSVPLNFPAANEPKGLQRSHRADGTAS